MPTRQPRTQKRALRFTILAASCRPREIRPENVMTEKLATLSFSDGKPSVDFPVLGGTVGPDVIDVRSLYAKTGMFTYDPGYLSTASTRSKITFIDGDEGILE